MVCRDKMTRSFDSRRSALGWGFPVGQHSKLGMVRAYSRLSPLPSMRDQHRGIYSPAPGIHVPEASLDVLARRFGEWLHYSYGGVVSFERQSFCFGVAENALPDCLGILCTTTDEACCGLRRFEWLGKESSFLFCNVGRSLHRLYLVAFLLHPQNPLIMPVNRPILVEKLVPVSSELGIISVDPRFPSRTSVTRRGYWRDHDQWHRVLFQDLASFVRILTVR
jgi:hypothetical protein